MGLSYMGLNFSKEIAKMSMELLGLLLELLLLLYTQKLQKKIQTAARSAAVYIFYVMAVMPESRFSRANSRVNSKVNSGAKSQNLGYKT